MSNRSLLLVFSLSCLCLQGFGAMLALQPAVPAMTKLTALRPTIERGLLNLCLGLERVTNTLEARENTVIAPLSVASIIALLLAGAEGHTKRELETIFGVENIPHREGDLHRILAKLFTELESSQQVENNLSYGSGLFVQKGVAIVPNYLKLATQVYRSEVVPLDFRRASYDISDFINKWVSNRTEGKITALLNDVVPPTTVMMIVNVFYFRGSWEETFSDKFTKLQKFHVSKTETIPISLMVGQINAYYGKVRGSHSVLGLPYKGGDITMYYVLPDGDLRKFVNSLIPDSIHHFVNNTLRQPTIVAIPRMKIEGTMEMSGPLSALGVSSLFSGTADLSGIGKGFYVNEMIHKVSIEVTETGTVGAAASASTILRDGSMPLFRADKPFLFFIYHHLTGSILFWGTVFRPEAVPSK